MSENIFTANERIEICSALGKPIRKGSPEALAVSDFDRVLNAIEETDAESASAYASIIHPNLYGVTETFLEWTFAVSAQLAKQFPENERDIIGLSYALWSEDVRADMTLAESHAFDCLQGIFNPEFLNPARVSEFRQQKEVQEPTMATVLLQRPSQLFDELLERLADKNFEKARLTFQLYFSDIRARHDLVCLFVSALGAAIQQNIDQNSASTIMQEALESCALLEGMWQLFESLPPEILAASLAEHLRGHFSGKDRKGSVKVVEEEDCYRLLFTPCGTGGALRQRSIKSLGILKEAQPETWHRSDQVPVYCSHCAKNELTAIERMGYPAWVTEFNPDPLQPCGWTVYKDPNLIPEKYFSRLGVVKDPAAFKTRK